MDTLEKVRGIISEQLDTDIKKMDPETKISSLDVDSLDLVEIIMAVEDEFDISIGEDEANEIDDLDSFVSLIETKMK